MNFSNKLTLALTVLHEERHPGTMEAAVDEYLDRYDGDVSDTFVHLLNDLIGHYQPQIEQAAQAYLDDIPEGTRPHISSSVTDMLQRPYEAIRPDHYATSDRPLREAGLDINNMRSRITGLRFTYELFKDKPRRLRVIQNLVGIYTEMADDITHAIELCTNLG